MNFLTDNPLVNLHGPMFLLVFAMVCFTGVLWAYMRVGTLDKSDRLPVPPIPVEIDPFELAYLRGGTPELVRLTILDLIGRGYLQHVELKAPSGKTAIIGPAPSAPDLSYLNPTERFVFDWMRGDKAMAEIMPGLPQSFEAKGMADQLKRELEEQELLTTNQQRSARWNAVLLPMGVVAGLAVYKILVALSRGRTNVLFLIAMCIATLFVTVWIANTPRLSKRGRAYLERIRDALAQLRGRTQALVSGGHHDHLILTVAAFGIATLQGTSYAYFPSMFERAAATGDGGIEVGSGSSCGSGCSSGGGSSCGSSCGGGCGGGCGGCGS